MRLSSLLSASVAVLALGCGTASAKETPIGTPIKQDAMEISSVYLQPIEMEPAGMMLPADKADVHLETDIHATAGNPNGFADGEWVPGLEVSYEVVKLDSGQKASGKYMPMVANDGPHYGDNAKLFGAGKYRLTLKISPPGMNFGRHVDKETGVGPWFKPFTVTEEFTYLGNGKKGGY